MNTTSFEPQEQLYDAYSLIITQGSQNFYIAMIILSTFVGGYLILQDSKHWAVSDNQKHLFFRFISVGALVGCAIPAYFAGGWVGKLAWHDLLGPKTVLGGILGAYFSAALYKRWFNFNIETADSFARGSCMIMFIGRIGCIMQHCCFGIVVPEPIGFDFGDGQHRLPIQLIEASYLLFLFYILQKMHTKDLLPNCRLYIFFMLYGSARFLLEFFREQIATNILGLGFYQWIALTLVIVGLIQFIRSTPPNKILSH